MLDPPVIPFQRTRSIVFHSKVRITFNFVDGSKLAGTLTELFPKHRHATIIRRSHPCVVGRSIDLKPIDPISEIGIVE
jgi:hypothetical protein